VSSWKPRDFAIAAVFIVLGFALSRVLPDWLWGGVALAGFVGSLWLSSRRNRRRQPASREWTPGSPPSPN
jgi:hypothetical protein